MIQRKLEETVTEERAEIWQMQGIKTHSTRNQRRNIRKMRQGMRDTAAPPEMYLPDLDNTPLSQALNNGLDWGMEDKLWWNVQS